MSALARLEAATAARTSASARWERMIRLARQEGHSLRTVARAAGVTHAAIARKLTAAGYPLAQKTKASE